MTTQTLWAWRSAMTSAREFHEKAAKERELNIPDMVRYTRLAGISDDHYSYARRLNGCQP